MHKGVKVAGMAYHEGMRLHWYGFLALVIGIFMFGYDAFAITTCDTNQVTDNTRSTANNVDKETGNITVSCERGKQYVVESKATSSSCTPVYVTINWLPGAERATPAQLADTSNKALDPKIVTMGLDKSFKDIGNCPGGETLTKAIKSDSFAQSQINNQHFDAISSQNDNNNAREAYTYLKQTAAHPELASGIDNAFTSNYSTIGSGGDQPSLNQSGPHGTAQLNDIIRGGSEDTVPESGTGGDFLGTHVIQGADGVNTLESANGSDRLGTDDVQDGNGVDAYYPRSTHNTFGTPPNEPKNYFSWGTWLKDVQMVPGEPDYTGRMGTHIGELYTDSWLDSGVKGVQGWWSGPADVAKNAPSESGSHFSDFSNSSIDFSKLDLVPQGESVTFNVEPPVETTISVPDSSVFQLKPQALDERLNADSGSTPLPEQRIPDFPVQRPNVGAVPTTQSVSSGVQYRNLSEYFTSNAQKLGASWFTPEERIANWGTKCGYTGGTATQNQALIGCLQSLYP